MKEIYDPSGLYFFISNRRNTLLTMIGGRILGYAGDGLYLVETISNGGIEGDILYVESADLWSATLHRTKDAMLKKMAEQKGYL